MALELLFLLLPVAALSGWLLGRRTGSSRQDRSHSLLSADYFKGLDFLLNEQPDKAIEVFIHMLEVDSETVETHFAIASLFRKRGEVDRAIRIHQNLIARPALKQRQREQALYELSVDYQRAGLLDRAEKLLQELLHENSDYRKRALMQLLNIYQQEKDWGKAINTGKHLQRLGEDAINPIVAHFFCEQAEQALLLHEHDAAIQLARRALQEDRRCVRASLIEGRTELAKGEWKSAVHALQQVEKQDPDFLPEALPLLREAHAQQGRTQELMAYLHGLLARHKGTSIRLTLAELIELQEGRAAASDFLSAELRQRPSLRGMARLMRYRQDASAGAAHDEWQILLELMDGLLEEKPVYACSECGYSGKLLSWQCPSCKQWNTIKPIAGVEGE